MKHDPALDSIARNTELLQAFLELHIRQEAYIQETLTKILELLQPRSPDRG